VSNENATRATKATTWRCVDQECGVVGQKVREKRRRGVRVPLMARALIALAVTVGGKSHRAVGEEYGVSTATVSRFAKTVREVRARRQQWANGELRREIKNALREKKRGGRRKEAMLVAGVHGPSVKKMYVVPE
jgi:hypothetical protein